MDATEATVSNWTDPPPKRRRKPDFDEQVMMTALRLMADVRIIDLMPYTVGMGSVDQLRERARQLVQEYERA